MTNPAKMAQRAIPKRQFRGSRLPNRPNCNVDYTTHHIPSRVCENRCPVLLVPSHRKRYLLTRAVATRAPEAAKQTAPRLYKTVQEVMGDHFCLHSKV